jgi:hypothetical protein
LVHLLAPEKQPVRKTHIMKAMKALRELKGVCKVLTKQVSVLRNYINVIRQFRLELKALSEFFPELQMT